MFITPHKHQEYFYTVFITAARNRGGCYRPGTVALLLVSVPVQQLELAVKVCGTIVFSYTFFSFLSNLLRAAAWPPPNSAPPPQNSKDKEKQPLTLTKKGTHEPHQPHQHQQRTKDYQTTS
ncbi:MAG: hypothetical protein LBI86_12715 [Treponema sp.]|jgi:hypothetical protein|nr:hypothetical protein [Treponema sp.]